MHWSLCSRINYHVALSSLIVGLSVQQELRESNSLRVESLLNSILLALVLRKSASEVMASLSAAASLYNFFWAHNGLWSAAYDCDGV